MGEHVQGDTDKLRAIEKRRAAGEPLQYILGQWEFMGLPINCDPRALIPRMETEFLAEMAINWLQKRGKPARILDICTGSGCIAIAIAYFFSKSTCVESTQVDCKKTRVTACDISSEALSLARENAELNGVSGMIDFIHSDLMVNIHGEFDLIITNPPYISTTEIHALPDSVKNYEPWQALHGGADGMDLYRRLAPAAYAALVPGGAVFLEIGPPEVADILRSAGFTNVSTGNDLAGLPRYVQGEKKHV